MIQRKKPKFYPRILKFFKIRTREVRLRIKQFSLIIMGKIRLAVVQDAR